MEFAQKANCWKEKETTFAVFNVIFRTDFCCHCSVSIEADPQGPEQVKFELPIGE